LVFFLGLLNVIGQTGTFAVIAGVAESAPAALVVPVAVFNRYFNRYSKLVRMSDQF